MKSDEEKREKRREKRWKKREGKMKRKHSFFVFLQNHKNLNRSVGS
jgi:hypothetical protein